MNAKTAVIILAEPGLGSKYTGKHGIKKLVHLEIFNDFRTAQYREWQIKNWSRSKKEKLIKGEWKQDR